MAISVRLLELFITNQCDTVVVITGDTDIAPAIRAAKSLFPQKQVGVGFPYLRHNRELANLADLHFQISKEQYNIHQFADPYMMRSGYQMRKPLAW